MENYPKLLSNDNNELALVLRRIIELRESDITDNTNLPQVFMSGRKVEKIPTSSADVATTDNLGDFNYDANYLYIVVDDSGAEWRRVALVTW